MSRLTTLLLASLTSLAAAACQSTTRPHVLTAGWDDQQHVTSSQRIAELMQRSAEQYGFDVDRLVRLDDAEASWEAFEAAWHEALLACGQDPRRELLVFLDVPGGLEPRAGGAATPHLYFRGAPPVPLDKLLHQLEVVRDNRVLFVLDTSFERDADGRTAPAAGPAPADWLARHASNPRHLVWITDDPRGRTQTKLRFEDVLENALTAVSHPRDWTALVHEVHADLLDEAPDLRPWTSAATEGPRFLLRHRAPLAEPAAE